MAPKAVVISQAPSLALARKLLSMRLPCTESFSPRTGTHRYAANLVVLDGVRYNLSTIHGVSRGASSTLRDGVYAEWSAQCGPGRPWMERALLCALVLEKAPSRRSVESKAQFRARVERETGHRYRDIPIANEDVIFDGPIVARRKFTYIVDTPDGYRRCTLTAE